MHPELDRRRAKHRSMAQMPRPGEGARRHRIPRNVVDSKHGKALGRTVPRVDVEGSASSGQFPGSSRCAASGLHLRIGAIAPSWGVIRAPVCGLSGRGARCPDAGRLGMCPGGAGGPGLQCMSFLCGNGFLMGRPYLPPGNESSRTSRPVPIPGCLTRESVPTSHLTEAQRVGATFIPR